VSRALWTDEGRGISERERARIERRGRLLARFLRFYGASWRLREEGWERCAAHRIDGGPLIFAYSHNRLSMLAYSHRDRGIQNLISSSRDGIFVAAMCSQLGMGSVMGSSSRGGAAALRELTRRASQGLDLGIAVDGPRGPRGRVKPGIVALAALSGLPVVPVSVSASPSKRFRSWDRHVLPYPFAKVLVRFGEPLLLARKAPEEERESFRLKIEFALASLSENLDRRLGQEPILPEEIDG